MERGGTFKKKEEEGEELSDVCIRTSKLWCADVLEHRLLGLVHRCTALLFLSLEPDPWVSHIQMSALPLDYISAPLFAFYSEISMLPNLT